MRRNYNCSREFAEVVSRLRGVKYKGISIENQIITSLYACFSDVQWKVAISDLARSFILSFFGKEEYIIEGNSSGILVSDLSFSSREDHRSLYRKIISSFDSREMCVLKVQKKFSFRRCIKIEKLRVLKRVYSIVSEAVGGSTNKLYFFFLILIQLNRIDEALKIDVKNIRGFVCKNVSGFKHEILFAEILRRSGIVSFNMQHGALYDFDKVEIPGAILDVMSTNYFLVWGRQSKRIADLYLPSSKSIICGNPKYTGINKRGRSNIRVVSFFFDHLAYSKSNFLMENLISELSDLDLVIKVKLHPSDKKERYKKIEKKVFFYDNFEDVQVVIEESDACVVHNSTVSLDVLASGIPRLKFKDSELIDSGYNLGDFSNRTEFVRLVSKLSHKKGYLDIMNMQEKEFEENFHQPIGMTIPEYYKRVIEEKIRKK